MEGASMRTSERLKSRVWRLFLLLLAPLLMGTTWIGVPLEEMADVIVILVPTHDHTLHVPAPVERPIKGQIVRLEKGKFSPPVIIHTANTITTPLKQGTPNRLFLKKFRDRDAYYIIGVLPVRQGGGK
jgi:hypothetical protein